MKQRFAQTINAVEKKTGLDLNRDGDVGELGETTAKDGGMKKRFNQTINAVEKKTGLDLDRDGDVGEVGGTTVITDEMRKRVTQTIHAVEKKTGLDCNRDGDVGEVGLTTEWDDTKPVPLLRKHSAGDFDFGIYDLNGKAIAESGAYHSYIKIFLSKGGAGKSAQPEKEAWIAEMAGAVSLFQCQTAEETSQVRSLFKMFEADATRGVSISDIEGDPIENDNWALREDVTLEEFFEGRPGAFSGLKTHVRHALADSHLVSNGATWEHPWHPALYNCQHLSKDCLDVLAPGVVAFYSECLMHSVNRLKLTEEAGLARTGIVVSVSKAFLSDRKNKATLDIWRKSFGEEKQPAEWYISRVQLWWIDCTFLAMNVTKGFDRRADKVELERNIRRWRNRCIREMNTSRFASTSREESRTNQLADATNRSGDDDDPLTPDEEVILHEYFRSFDVNHDGKISEQEMRKVFPTWSECDCRDMFAIFDKNKDGRIDFQEFVDWVMASDDADKPQSK